MEGADEGRPRAVVEDMVVATDVVVSIVDTTVAILLVAATVVATAVGDAVMRPIEDPTGRLRHSC